MWGYLFRPGEAGMPVDAPAARRWLTQDAAPGFVWLHFNLAHAAAEGGLRTHGEVGDRFFEALRQGSRSTRIEREGDALFAVFNDLTFDFAFEAGDVATLWTQATPRLLVSARLHPLRSVDKLRQRVKRGEPQDGPVALLDHLMRAQADEIERIARVAAERVDDIEDALLAGQHDGLATRLGRLRRLAVRLQRLLAIEPSTLLRLLADPPPWMEAKDLARLREASEDFATVLRDLGAMHERVKLLHDEAGARAAEQNNRSLFLLTMVTVFALPINLVAGLLGMNVGGIPLAEHPHGFWWVVGAVAIGTALAARYGFKRMRPRG